MSKRARFRSVALAAGFVVAASVLVSIPKRLELLQKLYDAGPYLNFRASNAENNAFLLKKTGCQDSMR